MHDPPVCCRTSSHVYRDFSSQPFFWCVQPIYIYFTVRLPLIGYIFVCLPNWASHLTHTNWLMMLLLFLISGRDDLSRLHNFVQKGAGRGVVHGLNCPSGNFCHWLPNARHGLVSEKFFSGVIQVGRSVPQNNWAKRQAKWQSLVLKPAFWRLDDTSYRSLLLFRLSSFQLSVEKKVVIGLVLTVRNRLEEKFSLNFSNLSEVKAENNLSTFSNNC